ncbi:MAG: tetratricopeptide repeat protein [Muribaculaceae bacterium]|nr:tetratricopeptide repeat protein [Muribaculaceae bacterium]
MLRVGQNALYFEDYMLSIQYFNQVISAKPYLAQPYFFRSIAKLNLEDYQGAEADATLAIERNPYITDAWEVRGVARQNQGKSAEAIEDYNHALTQLPDNRGILFNKALAQEDAGDYDGARESFDRLMKVYPGFDGAYMGRARLNLTTGDTIAAKADLDKALEINRNAVNAYVMRADISINSKEDYASALADMNEAIKLQPHFAGYFINRAFLRYKLDDYFGAMADYDYAVGLDPLNPVGWFNRGILRAEVSDNDKAIQDFTRVLQLDRDDARALYNRAMLYRETHQWDLALSDIDRVIAQFPDFAGAYYARFQVNSERGGHLRDAERDYNKAVELTKAAQAALKKKKEASAGVTSGNNASTAVGDVNADPGGDDETTVEEYTSQMVADRFMSLLTVENSTDLEGEYNNKNIRGKVQDRNITIEMEPMVVLSYYGSPTELQETGFYIKEVDDINSSRILRNAVIVTSRVPTIEDEGLVQRHFQSIEYYNSYLATHQPRAVEYFGRGMDFMTLRDYEPAIEDFTRAIALTPDWSLAYLMRALANYQMLKAESNGTERNVGGNHAKKGENAAVMTPEMRRAKLRGIIDDFDKTTELSPNMSFAYYDKGNVLLEEDDLTSAVSAYSKAIELKPDFGEAYYNRGYAYMKLGTREAGVADLSKAGELGVLPSYNLLKRMNR